MRLIFVFMVVLLLSIGIVSAASYYEFDGNTGSTLVADVDWRGMTFDINKTMILKNITQSSGSAAAFVMLYGYTEGYMGNVSFTGAVAHVNTTITLTAGRRYNFIARGPGGNFNIDHTTSLSYPRPNTYVTWISSFQTVAAAQNNLPVTNYTDRAMGITGIGISNIDMAVTLNSPIQGYNTTSKNISFDWFYSMINLNLTNWTFYLWNKTALVNKTINTDSDISSSYSLCYQEKTNGSSASDGNCGINYTGLYEDSSSCFSNFNWIDGNFNTFSQAGCDSGTVYSKYFKPSLVSNGATWRVKYNNNSVVMESNYSIPNSCIQGTNNVTLGISLGGFPSSLDLLCINSTSDVVTISNIGASGYPYIFEEGIYWNISKSNSTNVYNLPDGNYTWTVNACGNSSDGDFECDTSSNRTFRIDTTAPTVNLFYPMGSISRLLNNQNISLNYSMSDINLQSCGYIYNGVTKTLGCTSNATMIFNTNTSLILFANDTFGNIGYYATNISYDILETGQSYPTTALETSNQTFYINITYDSTRFSSPTGTLVYDGVEYVGSYVENTVNDLTFSRIIDIPAGNETNTFYWKFGITNSSGTNYVNSTSNQQHITLLNMSLCGAAPYNVPYINFTFVNETIALESIKATFDTTFTYYLSNIAVNKTFSYSSAVEQKNYTFCFVPNTTTVYLYSRGSYDNAESQQRSFNNNSVLTSTLSNLKLLLLPNSEGMYVTFIIQDGQQSRLENALISIVKTAGNVPVEQKYTDGTGIAAMWLDTGTNYIITITKSGYNTFVTSLTPATSPVTYTLTAEAGSSGTPSHPSNNIDIDILPTGSSLVNNTQYTFSFDISSNNRHLTEYGFWLWNKNTNLTGYTKGTSDHGSTITRSFNTGNQSYIVMKYYYIIGGNTTNGTYTWYVSQNIDSDTSIVRFLDDFKIFTNSSNGTGLFGLNRGQPNGDFSFALVIFLITFFIAGVMTYRYGITTLTATTFMIFAVVLFFDVGAGLIPSPLPDAVPHFASIFMFIIVIGAFVREMVT